MNKNYKKLYEEALSRARDLHDNYALGQPQTWSTCEKIFPELRESEDEEHRKWILEYLYDGLRKSDEQFKDHFKTAIDWLEAQGEQKSTDKVEQPAEWSKEDKRNFDIIYGIIYNSCNAEDASRLIEWLLSLRPQKQWKPSDNELEVLRLAAEKDGTCLMGLYEQLKKLKG